MCRGLIILKKKQPLSIQLKLLLQPLMMSRCAPSTTRSLSVSTKCCLTFNMQIKQHVLSYCHPEICLETATVQYQLLYRSVKFSLHLLLFSLEGIMRTRCLSPEDEFIFFSPLQGVFFFFSKFFFSHVSVTNCVTAGVKSFDLNVSHCHVVYLLHSV